MHFLIVFTLLLLPIAVPAQGLRQKVDTTAGFRGLAAIDRTVVWASGTGGTVIRTVDGGVAPPSTVRITVPPVPLAQTTVRSMAASPRNPAVVSTFCLSP